MQPTQANPPATLKKKRVPLITFILLIIILLITITISQFFQNKNEDSIKENKTKLISDKNWSKHSGEGILKFSIKAPEDALVCLDNEQTDSNCPNTGVYLNRDNFPYGIQLDKSELKESLRDMMLSVIKSQGYGESDIDFRKADKQLMSKGDETRRFRKPDGTEFEKQVYFTKYVIVLGDSIYLPTIYTNENYDNHETYKKILESWEFN